MSAYAKEKAKELREAIINDGEDGKPMLTTDEMHERMEAVMAEFLDAAYTEGSKGLHVKLDPDLSVTMFVEFGTRIQPEGLKMPLAGKTVYKSSPLNGPGIMFVQGLHEAVEEGRFQIQNRSAAAAENES